MLKLAGALIRYLHWPVIVAMIPVRVMQVPINQVINMVAVGHWLMSAPRAMNVFRVMSGTTVVRGADIRVGVRQLKGVLIHVIPMRMVQMAIVQVINVTVMLDCRMTAVRAVFMRMFLVNVAAHGSLL